MSGYFDARKREKEFQLKIKENSYSFGHRYNYWNKDKNNYITSKYSNLSQEILNNNIYKLDLNNFNFIKVKAKHKLSDCEYCKKIRAERSSEEYEIKEGSLMTIEHIISVLLYTDFNSLSFNLNKTFKSLSTSIALTSDDISNDFKDCKKRNSEYSNWSRLLIESVNIFGTKIGDSKVETYYHPINKLLIVSSFLTVFNAPISMYSQISIATIFAMNNGTIFELKKDSFKPKYFNTNWLSKWSNKDERIFICPPAPNYMTIKFSSIRCIETKKNYKQFINALTLLHCTIKGQSTSNLLSRKKDKLIIEKLLKHNDINNKYNNNFDEYINNTFYLFSSNILSINISIDEINRGNNNNLKKLFFDNNEVIKLNNICKLFKNCTKIIIGFGSTYMTNPFNLTSSYFAGLLSELKLLSKYNKNIKLKTIGLVCVKYTSPIYNLYMSEFREKGWKMSSEQHIDYLVDYYIISISR